MSQLPLLRDPEALEATEAQREKQSASVSGLHAHGHLDDLRGGGYMRPRGGIHCRAGRGQGVPGRRVCGRLAKVGGAPGGL